MSSTAITTKFQVDGMSCGHCVSSITTEVGAIPGVRDVRVDLPTGMVTVMSAGPIDRAALRTAVYEAGYQLD